MKKSKEEKSKKEKSKIEKSKIEKPKVEKSKIEKSKIEKPKVEKSKVEKSKVEKSKVEKSKIEKSKEEKKKNEKIIEKDTIKKEKEIIPKKNELCSHAKNDDIADQENFDFLKFLKERENICSKMEQNNYVYICLNCMEILDCKDKLDKHYNGNKSHRLYLNLKNWEISCLECSRQYNISLVETILKYRIIYNLIREIELFPPNDKIILSEKEIYNIKYEKTKKKFINKKYSNILFMVGAGISTSAGIPDFRSQTGLFKQLQDKYNLSSPEEFFQKDTFLEKPQYFYEFTKLFDLSKINSTISHKFMNFFVHKNMVKYIFTQNIDGLEIKAKIPEEKLIFPHGNFYKGHCGKCNKEIDIEKINEGVKNDKIYYCPDCNGPCKPNVVFYGEKLPARFHEKLDECGKSNIDLIIIMGTSLLVHPFASIPYRVNPNADIIVFNMERVGEFPYDSLLSSSLFIEGKTDETVVKFLKDINMLDEFKDFMKKEYNEEFKDKNEIEKLIGDFEKLKIK